MGHISWNVTQAAIEAMPEVKKEVQSIAAYLSDGITWSRLRGLLTRGVADGGLGLLHPLANESPDFFKESCGAIVDGRPESVYNILRFLGPRELKLRQVVGRDLEERNLSEDVQHARDALESPQGRARRIVACEVLRRCLWMHWNNMKHPFILGQSSFKRLAEKWAGMITATEVDDRVLEHLGVTRAEVDAMPQAPTTWIDVVVYKALGPAAAD